MYPNQTLPLQLQEFNERVEQDKPASLQQYKDLLYSLRGETVESFEAKMGATKRAGQGGSRDWWGDDGKLEALRIKEEFSDRSQKQQLVELNRRLAHDRRMILSQFTNRMKSLRGETAETIEAKMAAKKLRGGGKSRHMWRDDEKLEAMRVQEEFRNRTLEYQLVKLNRRLEQSRPRMLSQYENLMYSLRDETAESFEAGMRSRQANIDAAREAKSILYVNGPWEESEKLEYLKVREEFPNLRRAEQVDELNKRLDPGRPRSAGAFDNQKRSLKGETAASFEAKMRSKARSSSNAPTSGQD